MPPTTHAPHQDTGQQPLGLRERKKRETAHTLWETAIGLFLEHGFDNVTVSQIAAAANLSKMTVFNYFPTKEDLVLRPMESHVDDAARVVRERRAGETVVAALRRDFLAKLDARDAATGLSDAPHVLGVQRLLRDSPSLTRHALALRHRGERLLAAALAELPACPGPVVAHVAAAQIVGVREALVAENLRRLLDAGENPDAVRADAVTEAERGFGLLESGIGL